MKIGLFSLAYNCFIHFTTRSDLFNLVFQLPLVYAEHSWYTLLQEARTQVAGSFGKRFVGNTLDAAKGIGVLDN